MNIQEPSLVIVIGVPGSGKSTLAHKYFPPEAIVSSDRCRELLVYGEAPITATKDEYQHLQKVSQGAFYLFHSWIAARLTHGKLAVADATNLQEKARKPLEDMAQKANVPIVYIILDVPKQVCLERDALRKYPVGPEVIERYYTRLQQALQQLQGKPNVHVLTENDLKNVTINCTSRSSTTTVNFSVNHAKIDVIGDVHGCLDELELLLVKLGYNKGIDGLYQHPEGRIFVSLGDVIDRGPKSFEALLFVKKHVEANLAQMIVGNHDHKFLRYLRGRKVKVGNGLQLTIDQMPSNFTETDKMSLINFLSQLPSYLVMNLGSRQVVMTHASFQPRFLGKMNDEVQAQCMYGPTTGITKEGTPLRVSWEKTYNDPNLDVMYGHTVNSLGEAHVVNNTYGLDGGAVFGGSLIAMRLPEYQIVKQLSGQYWEFKPYPAD